MSIARPRLFSFDIFGTVVDWRRGLAEAAPSIRADQFDAIVDRQGELEQGRFRGYTEIVAQSLVDVAGLDPVTAAGIGTGVGSWPPFPDSAAALRKLRPIAPRAALTNSDVSHGAAVLSRLGGEMDHWICAERLRVYKPDPRVWREASRLLGVELGPHWWHVSAYGDYDLGVARSLGLTCVLVRRPHHRDGPHDVAVADLEELAALAAAGR